MQAIANLSALAPRNFGGGLDAAACWRWLEEQQVAEPGHVLNCWLELAAVEYEAGKREPDG